MRRALVAHSLSLVASVACINPPPLRDPPVAPELVTVETPSGDLDALGRVPSLTLRFDRPIAWPDLGAVMLVTGAASDALRADADDGTLSASNAPRSVAARLVRDLRNPAVLRLDALAALLPDTALTLLITSSLRSEEGAAFHDADGGRRARAIALTVAPARRCGALARVEPVAPGEAPMNTARIFVRFDRGVRLARPAAPLALVRDGAPPLASRASLDCLDGAIARCAWVEPVAALDRDAVYRVAFGPLVARNNVRVESDLDTFTTGDRFGAPAVHFGATPVCARDESAVGDFCVRVAARSFELRASTTGPALVRVTARAQTPAAPSRVALGASGTVHRVVVAAAADDTDHLLTAECLGLDGRVHETRALDPRRSAPTLPRVRIGEVLARPHSTSAQEFIELVNDGTTPANLGGYALMQGASRSVLPDDAVIAPGRRAVIVGPIFDPRGVPSQGDPPVAPGTTLVVLRTALAGRGLRDSGADVALADPEGRVVSQMPGSAPSRAPREGVSLVRAETELDDNDPAAWAWDALGGSTPGAPDRLR